MKSIKLFEQFIKESSKITIEDLKFLLAEYKKTLNLYIEKNKESKGAALKANEILNEFLYKAESEDSFLDKFYKWLDEGFTLKLQELMRLMDYKFMGNSPEELLIFNAFSLLDTVSLYHKTGELKESDLSFFEVLFGLVHAVKDELITEKEMNRITDAIPGNRIDIDKLKDIIGDKSKELVKFIIDKNK